MVYNVGRKKGVIYVNAVISLKADGREGRKQETTPSSSASNRETAVTNRIC